MGGSDSDSSRTMVESVTIAASPARVWEVLTDFKAIAAASPELIDMWALKPGGLHIGQWYLGLNRRGLVVWPTRNVIVDVAPERRLVWHTTTSGARWTFELTPDGDRTVLTERRDIPEGLAPLGKVFAGAFLGGGSGHADELESAIGTTLGLLKERAERAIG